MQLSLHRQLTGPVDLASTNSFSSDASVMSFEQQLRDLPVITGNVLGQIVFTGWDGTAQGAGAAIRIVYTVSDPTCPF